MRYYDYTLDYHLVLKPFLFLRSPAGWLTTLPRETVDPTANRTASESGGYELIVTIFG